MNRLSLFKGSCAPRDNSAIVNSLTYLAHYRHEPELKDKVLSIITRIYENDYVLRSDFDSLAEIFPSMKQLFEECAYEYIPDEKFDELYSDDDTPASEVDVYELLKNDESDNGNDYYYTYADFLLLFENVEYERLNNVKPLYQFGDIRPLTMRSFEKYQQFLGCLYSYLALPKAHRDNHIIFIPDNMVPVQLLYTNNTGSDPFHEDYPKGIKVNPGDFLTYNWDYCAYTPDFYAIQQLLIARETGEPYNADPDTKTYAIEISNDRYEFARKRLAAIKKLSQDPSTEAETSILSDIVEAYYRDHDKYEDEHTPFRVGPSSVDDVPTYWAALRAKRTLQPQINEIKLEISALNLNEYEANKLLEKRVHELVVKYLEQNPQYTGTGIVFHNLDI